jgi:quinol monooxygenase YgiN
MIDNPIILNVHIQAVPGREEELANELRALLIPTRTEPGCLAYELHRDPEDPRKFMFYEKFENQGALDMHLKSPHFEKFQAYLTTKSNPIAAQTVTKWRSIE